MSKRCPSEGTEAKFDVPCLHTRPGCEEPDQVSGRAGKGEGRNSAASQHHRRNAATVWGTVETAPSVAPSYFPELRRDCRVKRLKKKKKNIGECLTHVVLHQTDLGSS